MKLQTARYEGMYTEQINMQMKKIEALFTAKPCAENREDPFPSIELKAGARHLAIDEAEKALMGSNSGLFQMALS